MTLFTVEGIYKDGKVELSEPPTRVEGSARVLVTFLPAVDSNQVPVSDQASDREILRQEAFAQMKEGVDLGGPPYPRRDDH